MISTQIFCALPLSAQLVHENDPKYQFCNPSLLPLWDDVFYGCSLNGSDVLPNCLYIMFYHFAHVFVHPSLKKLSLSEEKIQIPYRKSISHVLYGSFPKYATNTFDL